MSGRVGYRPHSIHKLVIFLDKLKSYIEQMIFQTDDARIQDLLYEQKPYKKRSINLFVLVLFIATISVYATLSLLFMTFTLLLFIYWIVQVEFLSMRKEYKNPKVRHILYFNQAQKLIHKGKYNVALSLYQKYTMKHEDNDNMILYMIVLFQLDNTALLISEYEQAKIDSEIVKDLYKYSLFVEKEFSKLQKLIKQTELDVIYQAKINNKKIDIKKIIDIDLIDVAKHLN